MKKNMYIICITESLYCTLQTDKRLQINYNLKNLSKYPKYGNNVNKNLGFTENKTQKRD